jgi:hypothetical protein
VSPRRSPRSGSGGTRAPHAAAPHTPPLLLTVGDPCGRKEGGGEAPPPSTSPSPPPSALMGAPRAPLRRWRAPADRARFCPGDGRIRAHGPRICSLGAAVDCRSGGLVLHGGGDVLRPTAPGCSWGGRIRASGARICPLGAVAGRQSSVTGGGGGAHLRPGRSSVTGTCGLTDSGVLGDACGRRWVSIRGGGACFQAAGVRFRLWVAGAVPWWTSCGHRGVGLGRLASAAAAPAAAVAAAIAPEALARGSSLGGVRRCAGGALVARSATDSLCELVPAASWWCPWRWSCGGVDRVSLLGDNDAGENPFLLTRSGDGVVGAAVSFPFGGDIGHLGCLPGLRLGPAASSSTWCFAGRSVRMLFFSFSFLCEKRRKRKKRKKRKRV